MSNYTWSDYGWQDGGGNWLHNGWSDGGGNWMHNGWSDGGGNWMHNGWSDGGDSWMHNGWQDGWRDNTEESWSDDWSSSWSDDSDYEDEEEEEEDDDYEPYDGKYSWIDYESSYKETKKSSYPYYRAPSTSPVAVKVFNLIFDIVSLVINASIILIFLGMPSAYPAEEKPLYAFVRLIVALLALVIKPLKRQWWMLIVIVPILVWSLLAVIFPTSAL